MDTNGKACIEHLPEGLCSVEASSSGSGFLNVKYYPVRVVFPEDVNLSFRLPFGEIGEGGLLSEAILSGTLMDQGKPSGDVKICLFEGSKSLPFACTVTNDLGQYALIVPPGKYRLELSRAVARIFTATIAVPVPGYYRNRVSMPGTP